MPREIQPPATPSVSDDLHVARKEFDGAYQLFMLFLCVYAIVSLAVQMLFQLDREVATIIEYIDVVVCAAFFIDFLHSFYTAENRVRYFFTWGWIDLLSSIPAINGLRFGRIARMARILQVLRTIKATKYLLRHMATRPTSSALYSILTVAFSLVVVTSLSVLQFEAGAHGSNIETAEDALWWAMTTITTVGYGDVYPVTPEGRMVAVALMTAGVGMVGALSGTLAGWFLRPTGAPEKAALHDKIDAMQRTLDRIAAREETRND